MMTCREFEDFIVDYEDGALPRSKRFVFELHLAICSECRRYLGAYRNAIALAKAVFQKPDETVPAEVPEDLVKAILSARSRKP
jgi:anti-sigma factor RsiW